MFTRPSSDDLLEGCIISLQNDILPNLANEHAQVCAVMMQALLQCVRQRLPVEQQIMAAEHNQITALFREIGPLATGESEAAARLRERAASCGSHDDLPVPPAFDEVVTRYRDLSQALVETMDDLDTLLDEGEANAQEALQRVRTYLGARTAADFGTLVVGAGMAGRG
jgi:hypothetical protein